MKILFKNKSAERQFSSEYLKKQKYPEKVKIKLSAIRNALIQAESLHDIVQMPQYHFHSLSGARKNEWSIYVGNTGYRVTLIPCDDDGREITSGDIIAQCKTIKIILVTEVSKHYE